MRVLVTGGAGFIGSHTCVKLIEKGYKLIILDSYANSNEKSIDGIINILKLQRIKDINIDFDILKADIRDESALEKLFLDCQESGNPIHAVLHFAGLKSVRESFCKPLLYWDVNVNGSLTLFRIMEKYKCRTLVFSSSATIYGLNEDIPLHENIEIKPTNPYGNTKATIENLLNDIYKSSAGKWKIANLRYFNPIGAHSSGLIGEAPLGIPNNIFPYITQVAAGLLKKVKVYGNDWPTVDGTGVRDYIHVMDLAEGHIAALEYLSSKKPQIINLNLGTSQGTSVLELIEVFQSVNNINIPFEFSERRKGDRSTIIADNSLAISNLNWVPKRSLKQMCLDGWKWQSLHPNGYV
tara:strand:+ start:692 stop:1747 length:1056 start_codon:yes stop_codon:yes gene_type:complete